MLDDMLHALQRRDRRALARLLSLVARGENLPEIAARLPAAAKGSRVVAFTGSAGVGKSTLIGKLIEHIRELSQSVAVLACDPQSPLSGGALLGDRFRMASRPEDDGVYIRSLAAVSGRGAVAENLQLMIRVLESFGFDNIWIETVGSGQGDIAVHEVADVVVLLLQPQTGDDLQWEKAGVLEVADVIAVQKADLPGADQTLAQVKAALELSAQPAPMVRVSAKTGAGIEALWQTIQACPRGLFHRQIDSEGRARSERMSHVRHGFGSARPYVHGHLDLWDLVRDAFGAIEVERHEFGPKSFHIEARIGDSIVVLETGDPPHPTGTPGSVYLYVPDVDVAYQRALALGAASLEAPEDKPYQERAAGVRDTYGNTWWISTYRG